MVKSVQIRTDRLGKLVTVVHKSIEGGRNGASESLGPQNTENSASYKHSHCHYVSTASARQSETLFAPAPVKYITGVGFRV